MFRKRFLLSLLPAAVFCAAAEADGYSMASTVFWAAAVSYGVIAEFFRLTVLNVGEQATADIRARLGFIGHAIALQCFVALGVLQLVHLAGTA